MNEFAQEVHSRNCGSIVRHLINANFYLISFMSFLFVMNLILLI